MVAERLRRLRETTGGRLVRSRPVRDAVFMTFGVLLTAWALDAFLIPNRIAAGGVSGLATVAFYGLKGLGLRFVPPVGSQMLVMNLILLAIGIRARGWRYGAKTVYGAIGLSVAVDVLAPFTPHLAANDQLLAVLWGGALTGIGMGIVFRVGGNTGGTDIVAQLIADKVPLGAGRLLLFIDFGVLIAAGVVLGPTLALYGAVAVFIMGTAIEVVMEGFVTEKAAWIFSDEHADITEAIVSDLGRAAHIMPGADAETGDARPVVFTVVSRTELERLKSLVNAIDPKAFVMISDVHETYGEGFKEYRGR